MIFYEVETRCEQVLSIEKSREARREFAQTIAVRGNVFQSNLKHKVCFFISKINRDIVTVTAAEENASCFQRDFAGYTKQIGVPLEFLSCSEITLAQFRDRLTAADRMAFVCDDSEVIEALGLDEIINPRRCGINYGESLIEEHSRAEVEAAAKQYLMNNMMQTELVRIYSGCKHKSIKGHPAHYLLQTDDRDTRREVCRLLLSALYSNQRLSNRRYVFMDFYPTTDVDTDALSQLYNASEGGAVVIRYEANDTYASGNASREYQIIQTLCQKAKQYRNQVLTVFCLHRACANTKEMFYEELSGVSVVELVEEAATGARAEAFLKMLAKKEKVRTDKKLFSMLEADKGYQSEDLRRIFNLWYDRKLKTTAYPQYQQLMPVEQKSLQDQNKGSAYDELQQMIGLTEAKAVIEKALNYHKVQKLYETHGLPKEQPNLHMVFTGNPGTAKTSVARLFARILRENKLLAKGQLVEVGRGDLVGKYVGWTAKTVQEKFRAAKGGVLFIDEAYSLVDDRNGSYGDEAINTIVQEMENHRKDVVVIFAGYPDKMEGFLQKNPGLTSRIAFHVPFEDYTTQELRQIAQLMGEQKGLQFTEAALDKLTELFDSAKQRCDFGNGRYVRNALEQARMNQSGRILQLPFEEITAKELTTIHAEDIEQPETKVQEVRCRTIGFAS